ncbi:MAG TPA: PDZ domain-containing protein [Chloroflexota bacterium]|nr:PDZ domain-containing protein [Chloroflexota bacterium]
MARARQRVTAVPSVGDYVRGLQQHELELSDLLEARRESFSRHPGVYSAVERVRALGARQREALGVLLDEIGPPGDEASAADAPLAPPPSIDATIAGAHPVSDALAELQALLRRAAVGYQRLWVAGSNLGSRPTFRLAAEHMRAYAAAASELIPLLSEVMIWELREAGQECRCACAACGGLGTCLCGPASAILMERATRETVPSEPGGAPVWFIQPGSPAARAGLRSGDRIATADGAEIRDPWSLVNAASAAEKYGAPLTLGIERANGASENVTLTPRRSDSETERDQRQS